jgi:hypothetical protein
MSYVGPAELPVDVLEVIWLPGFIVELPPQLTSSVTKVTRQKNRKGNSKFLFIQSSVFHEWLSRSSSRGGKQTSELKTQALRSVASAGIGTAVYSIRLEAGVKYQTPLVLAGILSERLGLGLRVSLLS